MKKALLIVAFTISLGAGATSLSGCATGPTAYGPAIGNGLGFASQQIEKDRFQIDFTGRNADEARNFALLRAAELTTGQGYSHFRVVGSGTQKLGQGRGYNRSPISTSVGLGVSSGGGYRNHRRGSRTNVGVGININDLAQAMQGDRVSASLEIILQNQAYAGDDNVYDAQSILSSIKPNNFAH